MSDSKLFWKEYYQTHRLASKPSNFAKFVSPFLSENGYFIELGCGNGRDSIYFSDSSLKIISIDQCSDEINFLSKEFAAKDNISFMAGDMTTLDVLNDANYLYSRFTLHSVKLEQEVQILNWALQSLDKNGLFFIEVRSIHDELYGQGTKIGNHEFITDHYRRFVDLEEIKKRAIKIGFNILYSIQDRGFAPYSNEDPITIRLILQKP